MLFGIFQSFLLATFFFYIDSFRNPSKFFILSFLLLSLTFFLGIIFALNFPISYPDFSRVGLPIGAMIAPTFIMGAKKYFGTPKEHLFWTFLYFFTPVFIFIYCLPHYALPTEEKLSIILYENGNLKKDCILLNILSISSNLLIFSRMYYYLSLLSNEFNPKAFIELESFRKLIYYSIVLLFISLILFIFNPSVKTESFANAMLSVWVLLFAWNQIYKKVVQNDIFSNPSSIDKYSKSLLSLDQLNIYGKQIESFFQDKENTMNPDLNLELLSNHLHLSSNLTSQVINRYFSKTLLELIRMNRIALAIQFLETTDFSILRIGHEIGYNSKSSFLRAFREEKGTTPSLYRDSLKKRENS